jgi:hypothetical protein
MSSDGNENNESGKNKKSRTVKLNGHDIEVIPTGTITAIYSKYCSNVTFLDRYLSFIEKEKPSIVIGADFRIVSMDGCAYDIGDLDQDKILSDLCGVISRNLPGDARYMDLKRDINSDIALTSRELGEELHVDIKDVRLIGEHPDSAYSLRDLVDAELYLLRELKFIHDFEAIQRILLRVLAHNVAVDLLKEFSLQKDDIKKSYEGTVVKTPNDSVLIVSCNGDFITLNDDEVSDDGTYESLETGDHIELTPNVRSGFDILMVNRYNHEEIQEPIP